MMTTQLTSKNPSARLWNLHHAREQLLRWLGTSSAARLAEHDETSRTFETLEPRLLMAADLSLTATADVNVQILSEGGHTVIQVPASTTVHFTAAVTDSDRSDIEIFQLDFTGSELGVGNLTLTNWDTADAWSGQTLPIIGTISDTDITDGIVKGSAPDPGVGNGPLGTFDVTVPSTAGEWLLTVNKPGQVNLTTFDVTGTALVAAVDPNIITPSADLVIIEDFGDVIIRVLPATLPSVSIASTTVVEGDNAAVTSVSLDGTVRDFIGVGTTSVNSAGATAHPNFESQDSLEYRIENPGVVVADAVQTTLGGDGNPVFNGTGKPTFTNATDFNQWYNNTAGINSAQDLDLNLNFDGQTYTFTGAGATTGAFYPIDDALFGDTQGAEIFGDPVAPDHNWHFTYEGHATFIYQTGQEVTITSDDDAWLFINNQRVIDRGGANIAITRSVDLDTLGLTAGQSYSFDLFYAERHTVDAALQIETNIPLNIAADDQGQFAAFNVTLSAASVVTTRVDFSTSNGTGTAGTDFVNTTGTLVFAPGETQKTVLVPIIGNDTLQANRTLQVTLANPTTATINTAVGTGTITDDDQVVTPDVEVTATDPNADEDGPDNGVFTITRTGPTTDALTVNYTLAGTAVNGTDYTQLTGQAIIAANQTSVTVTVTPTDDGTLENNETVILTLTDAAAYNLGANDDATVTIADDDPTGTPAVEITATDPDASEDGPDNGVFTITRTGPTTAPLTVNYGITGTAANGTDYTLLTGAAIIPIGQSSVTITVTPTDDSDNEGNQTVIATLTDAVTYDLGQNAAATVTIADDDQASPPIVEVTATDPNASEDGPDNGVFTITRTGPVTDALTVNYTIAGTATNGTDYTQLTGQAIIAANETSVTVTVTPTDDGTLENNETVILTLTDAAAYNLGANDDATITIADDDPTGTPAVEITASDPDASEDGPDTGTFTITRTGPTTAALTVNYDVTGTASNGIDYTQLSGQVTIPIGASTVTVTVTPTDDNDDEGNQTVVATLTDAAAYNLGQSASATVTIADDDQVVTPVVEVTASDPDAAEEGPDNGVFTITRTGPTTAALVVSYGITGTASNGLDYTQLSGQVTIPIGAASITVNVVPNNDSTIENAETVILTVNDAAAYNVGASANATVTITDNDATGTPAVEVTASDPAAAEEGPDNGVFTITRTGPTTAALVVSYDVTGTASNGLDYTQLSGQVTIPIGASTVTINVVPSNDSTIENNETVILTLTDAAEYDLGASAAATVTITDNDATGTPAVEVTATDPDAAEDGPDNGVFTITRTGPTTAVLVVSYDITGTASNGTDYTQLSGQVNIPIGASSVTITVAPNDDNDDETNETVILTLTDTAQYDLGQNTAATVTIADDDVVVTPVVEVTASDPDAAEDGPDNGVFTITRTGPTTAALVVSYDISGTASNGIDYTQLSGQVTIPIGASSITVNVVPSDDSTEETNETVVLTLTDAVAYNLGASTAATVTITDDDQVIVPVVEVTPTDPNAAEAAQDVGVFTITRTGPTTAALVVNYDVTGTASNGLDYTQLSGQVTIPIGAASVTVTVTPTNDSAIETNETVILTLTDAAAYNLGANTAATVTIADNDATLSSISGVKFSDVDGDGVRDAGEVGIPGVTIFLDANENGTLDQNEVSRTTDANGFYEFANLTPGEFRVVEVPTAGATQTAPEYSTILLGANEVQTPAVQTPGTGFARFSLDQVTNQLFFEVSFTGLQGGTQQIHIHRGAAGTNGQVLFDLEDIAGVTDGFTSPVTGVIDLEDDLLGLTLQQVLTDLNAGNLYVNIHSSAFPNGEIRGQIDDGNFHQVVLAPGQAAINRDFGNTLAVGDVTIAATDPDAAELDLNPGAFTITRTGPTNLPLTVTYTIAGSALNGTDYQTITAQAIIPAGQSTVQVTITPIDDATDESAETVLLTLTDGPDYNLGATAVATVTIADNDPLAAAPAISGIKWSDLDSDGIRDAGEPGLAGVVIFLDTDQDGLLDQGEVSTITGPDGEYVFNNLVPGTYHVAEVLTAGSTQTFPTITDTFQLQRLATGLANPLYATAPAGDTDRLFIVEQTGAIKILNLDTNTINATPFINLSSLVSFDDERGLLGLAFHPDYATNGKFYVNYTNTAGDTVIAEYTVSAAADIANPASARILLTIDQPFANHNAGWLGFGPDGFLYIPTGDGGDSNDPQNNAQDITNNLLGKVLRIDVNTDEFPGDATRNYGIPNDNPFVGTTGDDEIWAYGLRNPFRASFDSATGDFYIGDVGQNTREEINIQLSTSNGGENYGWRLREGNIQNPAPVGGAVPSGNVNPAYDYIHGSGEFQGETVIGGYVYHGSIDQFQNLYFFADYISGHVWTLNPNAANIPASVNNVDTELTPNVGTLDSPSSFAQDAAGNLYLIDLGDFGNSTGEIYRLTDTSTLASHNVVVAAGQVVQNINFGNHIEVTAPEIEVRGNNVSIADADITPSAADFTQFANTFITGGTATRTFTIRNTGDAPLNLSGTPLVQITGADAAFFTLTTPPTGTLAPGASTTFTVTFDPNAVRTFNATLSIANSDADENPFDFAISGAGIDVTEVARIGKAFNGQTKTTVTDDFANSFEFNFPGTGVLIVTRGSDGRISARVEGSDDRSTLTIRNRDPQGDSRMDSLTGNGPMSSVSGSDIDFVGNITFAGRVGKLDLGDLVTADHVVQLGGTSADKPTTVTFDFMRDVIFTSGAPISTFTALQWEDADQVHDDSFTAPYVGTLNLKGDRRQNFPGEFAADLTLSGQGATKKTLTTAKVAGGINGTDWDITGDVGSIDIKGPIDSWTLNIHSDLASLKLGDVDDADVTVAGIIGTLQATRWQDGALNAQAINSLKIVGNKSDQIAGDFGVDVTLTGNADAKKTLGSASVAGAVAGSTWTLTGDTGAIDLKGAITNWTLVATGDLTTLKLGDTAQASVTVNGDVGTAQAVRWLDGLLDADSVKTLKTVGNKSAAIAGDFGADLALSGNPALKATLGSAAIAGTLLASTWRVTGPAGNVTANAVATGFDAIINGAAGTLTSKGLFSGQFAAQSFKKVDIKGDLTNAAIFAGGGAGPNFITAFSVGGNVNASRVTVGVNPVNGIFGDVDDIFRGGPANLLKSLTIKGTASADSRFRAGAFPATVTINKVKVNPLTDPRFIVTPA